MNTLMLHTAELQYLPFSGFLEQGTKDSFRLCSP